MQSLEHRSVLIVGGSRGLGLGVVEALAAPDANVTVIARDAARLTDLEARLGLPNPARNACVVAKLPVLAHTVRPPFTQKDPYVVWPRR